MDTVKGIPVAAPQFLPIPESLLALACETVSRRTGRLPFTRDGVEVTETLIGLVLECLNAEVTRTLPLKPSVLSPGSRPDLGECLRARTGADVNAVVPVIAAVLVSAGLAETAEIADPATHEKLRGIRLLPAWTWHIGSGEFHTGITRSETEDESWLARCPVCRTGILSRIVGKRLFGIPPTDYYLDCSHCGAKFIPERDRFRLVSIARISDPVWRQVLNSSRTPGEWAEMAAKEQTVVQRPAVRIPTSGYRIAARKPELPKPAAPATRKPGPSHPVEGDSVPFTTRSDGTLTVTGTAKTYYFRNSPVRFLRGVRHDLFTRSERILVDALESPAYAEVKPVFSREFVRYLPLRRGPVAEELRKKNDQRYRLLLNRYGDEDFSTFALDDAERAPQKGILIIYAQGKLCHLAACHTSFGDLIDQSFGNIRPDQCYLDGDETACRINSLVTAFKATPILFFHMLDDDAAIDAGTRDIWQRYLGGSGRNT